jgi:hypothetical protein
LPHADLKLRNQWEPKFIQLIKFRGTPNGVKFTLADYQWPAHEGATCTVCVDLFPALDFLFCSFPGIAPLENVSADFDLLNDAISCKPPRSHNTAIFHLGELFPEDLLCLGGKQVFSLNVEAKKLKTKRQIWVICDSYVAAPRSNLCAFCKNTIDSFSEKLSSENLPKTPTQRDFPNQVCPFKNFATTQSIHKNSKLNQRNSARGICKMSKSIEIYRGQIYLGHKLHKSENNYTESSPVVWAPRKCI